MTLKQTDTILTDTPLAPIAGAVYSGGTPGESKVIAVDVNGVIQTSGGSGTVTANQGTPASTANRWPVQVTDGTDLALVTAAGEQNVIATAQPGVDIGDVTINNAAGAAAVNVQDGGNSLTVDGTVTANAGTNLNTSALALETGNLKIIADSLNTMDDWDESDRAKVNLIVGQAGVAAADRGRRRAGRELPTGNAGTPRPRA